MAEPSQPRLFNVIKSQYGVQVQRLVNIYTRAECKLARLREQLTFNIRCKYMKVILPSLKVKPLVKTAEGYRIAKECSYRFLLARIKENVSSIKRLESDIRDRREDLRLALSSHHFSTVHEVGLARSRYESKVSRSRMRRKFERLVRRCNEDVQKQGKWVVNLSSKELSQPEQSVLSKGLNFTPVPKWVPISRFVVAIENGLQTVSDDTAEDIRQRMIGLLKKFKLPRSNLSNEECKAIKKLQKDTSLAILPADKGRATVVMDMSQYDSKMVSLLSDESTYKVLKKDPTQSFERKMNGLLLKLKKEQRLPLAQYNALRSSSGSIPAIYGLPKVHKDSIPLRPIVSFCTSPTYNLSKYLVTLLSPLVGGSPSAIKNSQDFVSFIQQQCLKEEEILVSFDVISLFTKVSVALALGVARRRLECDESLKDRTSLLVDDIMELLSLCLNATYFSFAVLYISRYMALLWGLLFQLSLLIW